jgi:hypothetical protein
MASNRGILFVHGVAACNQRENASGPDHIQAFRKKIIVYGMCQVRTSAVQRIVDRIVAKRYVSDGYVKEIFGKRCVLERFGMDVRIRIQLGGNAGGH